MDSNSASSQSSDLAPLIGTRLASRYVLQREIGSGSTTAIFDAMDERTGRVVTFKLIRPRLAAVAEFKDSFDEQMRLASGLRHPNIAAVYDWGYTEVATIPTAYIVIERLTGGSLRDMFDRGRRLSPSQALAVGLDAAKGLDYAHRRDIIHTELTPAKIMFGDDRRLRLIDFGLSQLIGKLMWSDPSNVPTHLAWYAAPEQATGGEVTGRADVYSLGLVLTEAITGSLPFKADSTVATLDARVGKLLPVTADMGPLASVLEHAARPDPEDRLSAAGLGKNLVHSATRLPRPAPLPLLSTGLFETPDDQIRDPKDPTGGVRRPASPVRPGVRPRTPEDASVRGPSAAARQVTDRDGRPVVVPADEMTVREIGREIGRDVGSQEQDPAEVDVVAVSNDSGVAEVDEVIVAPTAGATGGRADDGGDLDDLDDDLDGLDDDLDDDLDDLGDDLDDDLDDLGDDLDDDLDDLGDDLDDDLDDLGDDLDDDLDDFATGVIPVIGAVSPESGRPDDAAGLDSQPETLRSGGIDLTGIDLSEPDIDSDDDATGLVVAVASGFGSDDSGDAGLDTGVVPITALADDGDGDGDAIGFADEDHDDAATGLVPIVVAGQLPSDDRSTTISFDDADGVGSEVFIAPLDSPDAKHDPSQAATGTVPVVAASPGGARTATLPAQTPPVALDGGDRAAAGRSRRFPLKTMIGLLVVIALVVVGFLAANLLRSDQYVVPELTGRPLAEANNLIAGNGWVVSVVHERSDEVPTPDLVVRTTPKAGVEVPRGEPFEIVVSDGPVQRQLPDLAGKPAGEAQAQLQQLGMVVTVDRVYDEKVAKEIVISWNVPSDATLKPGAFVDPGTSVVLIVSDGPEPRAVPDLVNKTKDEATKLLTDLGLTLSEQSTEFSETIGKGKVISQSVAAGTKVERGSDVAVVISNGPPVVKFPDLTNVTGYEAIKKAVEDAGFTTELVLGDGTGSQVTYRINGQVPTPGQEFPKGTKVDFEVI